MLVEHSAAGKFPRNIVVDAGASDNMVRFLRDKFVRSGGSANFEAFVITHPDQDHYNGFDPIFGEPKFTVDTVYHSGLVERKTAAAGDVLGAKAKVGSKSYMTELVATQLELDNLLTPANIDRKQYPQMLRKAIDSGRVGDIRMLNADDKFMPGCGPGDTATIQVLGPVPETVNGSPALRWFGDVGKTKNGHSIVLRLTYGKVSILLGGDLNIPAEEYLLEHYTGEPMPPRTAQDEELIVKKHDVSLKVTLQNRATTVRLISPSISYKRSTLTPRSFLRATMSLMRIREPIRWGRSASTVVVGAHRSFRQNWLDLHQSR